MEGDDFPLNTTVIPPNTRKYINIDRVLTLGRGSCLLLLLRYRFKNPLQGLFLIWAIAGFCECLFVLNFIVYSLLKWRPVERQTYPHTPIVEVLNNIEIGRSEWNAPLLVYVAREKRKEYKHEFKAGALNALMRVSGVLSNSPFILNLDCDTYINDSNACHVLFYGHKARRKCGFCAVSTSV